MSDVGCGMSDGVPLTCHQVCALRPRTLTRGRVSGTVGLVLSVALFSGCVTERLDSRGVPIEPKQKSSARAPASQPQQRSTGAPEPLPASKPVGARSTISSVAVELRPIGVVPFDGLVLPIISPDGRFLATQTGTAPTWDTLLATNRQAPADGTRIEAYDISQGRPARLSWPEGAGPPPGAILGRNGDDEGFLIESPRPDGARWVGRIAWVKAGVDWLQQRNATISCAVVAPREEAVAWIERDDRVPVPHMYIKRQERKSDFMMPARDPVGELAFPSLSNGGRRVYAFHFSKTGLEVVAFNFQLSTGELIAPFARRFLCAGDDPILAYQAAAGTQPVPYHPAGTPAHDADAGLLFFHPGEGRMALFDPSNGAIVLLADDSIAGCWAHESDRIGVFVTTPRGLVYQRLTRDGQSWNVSEPVRVLADPWVARSTTNPERPFILIGPGPKSNPNSLTIAAMKPTE